MISHSRDPLESAQLERIAIVGLGYVGLPAALAFAKRFYGTVGFDVSARRVAALRRGVDETREVSAEELSVTTLEITDEPGRLAGASFFVVAVPTPIDRAHAPDLEPLRRATETIGGQLRRGSVVVYESTVYPGVTEDVCGPLLERVSGLRRGVDFTLGYSPERINPGDREHGFASVVKIVAGDDPATLERVASVYGRVVDAGIHCAPSIKVAETAKVLENVQRDLNIALMNELAMICDRIGIRTRDVIDAASTKWNFLKFEPGLVGGHCIGVDPYYLTTLAESIGFDSQVIRAGRRVNEAMGRFVAQRLVRLLAGAYVRPKDARVAVLGLSFKPDVPDLRNTKVVDIVDELRRFGIDPAVCDPIVSVDDALDQYGLRLVSRAELAELHALILAVPHRELLAEPPEQLLQAGGIFVDLKSAIDPRRLRQGFVYWSL